jgi:hypothetical protein
MVMVGQNQRLREPLRWTKAGKVTVAAAAGVVLAAVVALVVALALGGSALPHGCISVTFQSNVGGATVQSCGAKARQDCADPTHSSLKTALGPLEDACRQAKLPYATAAS